jgi:hypothetical protein
MQAVDIDILPFKSHSSLRGILVVLISMHLMRDIEAKRTLNFIVIKVLLWSCIIIQQGTIIWGITTVEP